MLIAAASAVMQVESAAAQDDKAATAVGDWIYQCQAKDDGKKECILSQTVVDGASRRPVGRFTIGRDSQTNEVVFAVLVPLGIDIPRGVNGAIDNRYTFGLTVVTCLSEGCIARTRLDPRLLLAMKMGERLSVAFTIRGAARETVLPGSLAGITKGIAATGLE